MKVAVLSYPMLFQTRGGLSMKIQRTVEALNGLGVEARLIDPVRERLRDFDLVHVFAAYNGNHRIVEQAKADGRPVVISTILNPPYTRAQGRTARMLSKVVGRLTRWEVTTTHHQVETALGQADHLVVLGGIERSMLVDGYNARDDRITVVPNGIGDEFFVADGDLFRRTFGISRPFVLHTGLIGEVKNQLGLVTALARDDVDVILIGYAGAPQRDYLARCLEVGGARVRHLGEVPHGELIASACAAASVIAIPSRHEGMPNSILEGLAADRPVVLTNNHAMDFRLPPEVAVEVGPDDHAGIRASVLRFLAEPPLDGRARAVVRGMSWEAVAKRLIAIYRACGVAP